MVETVLAIGIVSFALLALMGMVPVGLASFRSSIDTSVGSQIFQRVISDAEQTDFQSLLDQAETNSGEFYLLPPRYFDDQGNEVEIKGETPTAADRLKILYEVRVRGSNPGPDDPEKQTASFTSLPASPNGTRFSPRDSTFITVQIANNPTGRKIETNDQLLWDPRDAATKSIPIHSYSAIITRNTYPQK